MSAGAQTVANAGTAGVTFFAQLNKAGNFVPLIAEAASIAPGETPIVIRWDYLALTDKDTLKGNPNINVVVAKSGVVAGVYVQAISAYASHPNAAKLLPAANYAQAAFPTTDQQSQYKDVITLGWDSVVSVNVK